MKLDVAVYEFAEFISLDVINTIPLPVNFGILEPEIRRKVYNPGGQLAEILKFFHTAGMGQRREYKIDRFQVLYAAKFETGSFAQIGMQPGYRLAHKSFRGALVDLHLGMLQQQSQQFTAAVS
jgi:hypothetical protein